jgi:ABC-type uncharacterized transport system ATPase subunit
MTARLLEADGLVMRFGGVVAVNAMSLALDRGALSCIIGPNGAGKSTLFNLLSGALRPQLGSIRFEGQDVTGRPVHRMARLGVARKFQVPSVFDTMTVTANLDVARRTRGAAAERGARIAGLLDSLGLASAAERPARALSHGQKQWLEIGMALMTAPKLLLLDEPTAGMSLEETRKTARLLQSLAGGMTILVIEHDMSFVRALACPTVVMHQGRTIAAGPFGEIERDATVRDVYLGRQ